MTALMDRDPITILRRPSALRVREGILPVRILQCRTGVDLLGTSDPTGPARGEWTTDQLVDATSLLSGAVPEGLTAIGWHPGLHAIPWGDLGDRTVTAGLGQCAPTEAPSGAGEAWPDLVRVAGPGIEVDVAKTCLSQKDLADEVAPGDHALVFERPMQEDGSRDPGFVSWAVLNCFEYTHPLIIEELEKLEVEVVVVLSANIATRQYFESAIADTHRLFAYVVLANIAEAGRSAVFAPVRRRGNEGTGRLTVGGCLLEARGTGAVTLDVDLSLTELRAAREGFRAKGFAEIDGDPGAKRTADLMVPSQRYVDTSVPGDIVGWGPVAATVRPDERLDWHAGDIVTVGVAQLRAPEAKVYRAHEYRLECWEHYQEHVRNIRRWLAHATTLRGQSVAGEEGRPLDLMVLPEVFVPRALTEDLRRFAEQHHCTVIAGMDYAEGQRANECFVFPNDGSEPRTYRKITRSQYDAQTPDDGRLDMERGSSLIRFTSSEGRSLGVLICYDFSHIGLMNRLNLDRRQEPLDLVAVVAHNPYGELYRSGCLADAHRYYQYIAMSNVAAYGGSGIFAPMRRKGPRQVLAEVGVGTQAVAVADLDLGRLQVARIHDGHDRRVAHDGLTERRRQREEVDLTSEDMFMRPSAANQRRVAPVAGGPDGSSVR